MQTMPHNNAGTRHEPTQYRFPGARGSECQWYQLSHMQVCTLPQIDNHAGTISTVYYICICQQL